MLVKELYTFSFFFSFSLVKLLCLLQVEMHIFGIFTCLIILSLIFGLVKVFVASLFVLTHVKFLKYAFI
jgi:hypothetical protein